jgi:hypothetical protein
MSAYKSKENNWKWPDESHESKNHNSNPSKEDRQKFWKSWNAWYKKQIDVREQVKFHPISVIHTKYIIFYQCLLFLFHNLMNR